MSTNKYLFDNSAVEAGIRFDALSEIFDETTFQHIEKLGIKKGWKCWEVGAGGTKVVSWLADQAGPDGYVLATDIDVSWAQKAAGGVVAVRRHDISLDDPPPEKFDLIHARLVLIHLPNRDLVLRSLIASLRPGGWLLIEDADIALQPLACIEAKTAEQQLANKIRNASRVLLLERGVDFEYGRKLPGLMRSAGLTDVRADAYFPITLPACSILETASIEHIRDKLISRGIASADEVDRNLANIASGKLDLSTSPLISAWGRRN